MTNDNSSLPVAPAWTEESFLLVCRELAARHNEWAFQCRDKDCDPIENNSYRRKPNTIVVKEKFNDHYLGISWETGGASGGNCWDGEAESYYISDPDIPEFTGLTELLKRVCPNVSYLVGKEIEGLCESDSYTNNEYYGNYTDYAVKKISFQKIWDCLKRNNMV